MSKSKKEIEERLKKLEELRIKGSEDIFEEVLELPEGDPKLTLPKNEEDPKEKSISNLAELENAESEHVMDPTNDEEKEDIQQESTVLPNPSMEGMNVPISVGENGSGGVMPKLTPLTGKAFKDFVENKGLDVELSADNKTVICKNVMGFSNINKRTIEDYKPSQEDLDIINKMGNVDIKRDEILCFSLRSADIAVDRSYEHFADGALQKMANMSVGKSFLMDHNWTTDSHIGKIYAAKAVDGQLLQKVYVANEDYNRKTIKNILLGIYNKVSVGFGVDLNAMLCDSCGNKSFYDEACMHTVGSLDEKGGTTTITIKDVSDYYEVSLVPVPAQRDAGISRSMVKSVIATERPETLTNPELVIKDLQEVSETKEKIKDSDTINNDRFILGDKAVSKNEKDEAKSADLENIPAVDEKPSHVDTSQKGEEEPDEDDKEEKEEVAEDKCSDLNYDKDKKTLVQSVKKLSKLAKKQAKELKKQRKASEEKMTTLEAQLKEVGEKLVLLAKAMEDAMKLSVDTVIQEATMSPSQCSKSANEIYSELHRAFIQGGK